MAHRRDQDVQFTGSGSKTFQYTEEELAVLTQCRQESTNKSIISGSLGMLAPFVVAKIGCGLLGFMAGKIYSASLCTARILQLENSPLADALRQAKSKGGAGGLDILREMKRPPDETVKMDTASSGKLTDFYSESNIDSDSNMTMSGLDDNLRPDIDKDVVKKLRETGQVYKAQTSYGELRERNRNEFEARSSRSSQSTSRPPASFQSSDLTPSEPLGSYQVRRGKEQDERSSSKPRLNKYGDVTEE